MAEKVQKVQSDESLELLVGDLAGEFFEKLERGEQPDIEDYARRFPDIADKLRQGLSALLLLGQSSGSQLGSDAVLQQHSPLSGVLGDFRILHEIGRGGMGVVYEAEQISLRRRVALKVLAGAGMLDPRSLSRFKNEVHAAASLDHPHIVDVIGVGCERGIHYYAMRLIRGQSLAEVIAQLRDCKGSERGTELSSISRLLFAEATGASKATNEFLSVPPASPIADTKRQALARQSTIARSGRTAEFFQSAARLGREAATGLQHAHDQGIIHRDIKPGNLLLDGEGRLYIADFGLARIEADAGLTMSGDLIGTLRYMAPEQALGKRVVIDHRADIYSLGATLYELLTLESPFAETDRQELLKQIAFQEPRPLRKLERSIPVDLETIVLKALAKDPGQRYQTAAELADDLQAFQQKRAIRAKSPTLGQRFGNWSQHHRGAIASAAAVLLLACLALGVALAVNVRQNLALQTALGDAQSARARAEKNWRQTIAIFHDVIDLWNAPDAEAATMFPKLFVQMHRQLEAAESINQGEPELLYELVRIGNTAATFIGGKDLQEGKAVQDRTVSRAERLVEMAPRDTRYHAAYAGALTAYVSWGTDWSTPDEKIVHAKMARALEGIPSAMEKLRKHLASCPSAELQTGLANVMDYQYQWQLHLQQAEAARLSRDEWLGHVCANLTTAPTDPLLLSDYLRHLLDSGRELQLRGRSSEAEPLLWRVVNDSASQPGWMQVRSSPPMFALGYEQLAGIWQSEGRTADSRQFLPAGAARLKALYTSLPDRNPRSRVAPVQRYAQLLETADLSAEAAEYRAWAEELAR